MSVLESIPPQRLSDVQQSFVIRWRSQPMVRVNGGAARTLVLGVEVLSPDSAQVEAWVEHHGCRTEVLKRQSLAAITSVEHHLLHIDLIGHNGDGRIAAISMFAGEHQPFGERALYAQTSLLEKAGFRAGSYDPPTLTRVL